MENKESHHQHYCLCLKQLWMVVLESLSESGIGDVCGCWAGKGVCSCWAGKAHAGMLSL